MNAIPVWPQLSQTKTVHIAIFLKTIVSVAGSQTAGLDIVMRSKFGTTVNVKTVQYTCELKVEIHIVQLMHVTIIKQSMLQVNAPLIMFLHQYKHLN